MVMNLLNLQSALPTIDGERGTEIPYQIFMDEELGLKKDPSRTRDHTQN
jgi:hypothetical protein